MTTKIFIKKFDFATRKDISGSIIRRIHEEYQIILDFVVEKSNPGIGFWTLIRMIMPAIEMASKLERKKPYELLGEFGIPEPEIAWTMFRDGLMHSEKPFYVIKNKVTYDWGVGFGMNHRTMGSGVIIIMINPPLLLESLEKYLTKFENDTTEVKFQTGKECS